MGRIVSFVGCHSGVGASLMCVEVAKRLAAKKYKTCLLDFYFAMNDIVFLFDKDVKFDLKDYLIGKIGIDGIVNEIASNLYIIKSDAFRFDYLKFSSDIKKLIFDLSLRFDFVIIDVNSFDVRNLALAASVASEGLLVFDNQFTSIRLLPRVQKNLKALNKNIDLKFVMNRSKIMGQKSYKYLTKKEVENIIGESVFFEIPEFFINNQKQRRFKDKIFNCFYNSFITNKSANLNYKKSYNGITGKLKRLIYEKFE